MNCRVGILNAGGVSCLDYLIVIGSCGFTGEGRRYWNSTEFHHKVKIISDRINITMIDEILNKIDQKNKIHAKKLRKNALSLGPAYRDKFSDFLDKYNLYLMQCGKTMDFAVDSYLKMCADMMYEQIRFQESGRYTNSSFEEVNKQVYNNPEIMHYHMHGLLLSQYLWAHHYKINMFFLKVLPQYKNSIKSYLEIGGGFGYTMSEALKILNKNTLFELVDISKVSLEIARDFIGPSEVTYTLSNIFEFDTDYKYDFITLGEVLEHVEDPMSLLRKVSRLLKDDGYLYITTPANAPTIDHIYLFRNADEIRNVIQKSGFSIIEDITVYAEDVPKEKAEKLKVTMMYGALLKNGKM